MSLTTVLTDLNIPVLEKRVILMRENRSFLDRAGIVGQGQNFPVMLKDFPNAQKGDTARFTLRAPLKAASVASGSGGGIAPFTTDATYKLTGQEEALIYSVANATMDVRRHAVKLDGEKTDQQMAVEIMQDALPALKKRVSDAKDYGFFSAMRMATEYDVTTGGVTRAPNAVSVLQGEAETWAGVATTQKMTVERIKRIPYKADLRSIDEVELPGLGMVRGILVMTPGQFNDLIEDEDYDTAVQQAQPRGDKNPFFNGSMVNINGVYLFVNRCTAGVAGATGVSFLRQEALNETLDKAEAIFLGPAACGFARKYDFKIAQADVTDYGDQPGLAGKFFGGFVKTTINDGDYSTAYSRDFSTIYVPTTQPKVTV
jgi:N4-gp56 family major capsid protein